jgi:hypothetical protein
LFFNDPASLGGPGIRLKRLRGGSILTGQCL